VAARFSTCKQFRCGWLPIATFAATLIPEFLLLAPGLLYKFIDRGANVLSRWSSAHVISRVRTETSIAALGPIIAVPFRGPHDLALS
jgi:hypothetical protein